MAEDLNEERFRHRDAPQFDARPPLARRGLAHGSVPSLGRWLFFVRVTERPILESLIFAQQSEELGERRRRHPRTFLLEPHPELADGDEHLRILLHHPFDPIQKLLGATRALHSPRSGGPDYTAAGGRAATDPSGVPASKQRRLVLLPRERLRWYLWPAMRHSDAVVLRVHELTKEFDGIVAVDHVSFAISRGEIVGLLGANGAGKTTTLQLILGLIRPTSGRIEIFGQDLERHRIEILRRMNFSSVGVNLPPNLTVWENLWLFAQLYAVPRAEERIADVLDLLEIAHLRNARTGRLSSGEMTRVNLCKALLNDPELLLLDEPTASLDPNIADKVRRLLREIQRERQIAMLYTSHNMRDIEEVCDRILFLHRGRIIAEGSPREILRHFRTRTLEEVFIRIARSGEILVGQEER